MFETLKSYITLTTTRKRETVAYFNWVLRPIMDLKTVNSQAKRDLKIQKETRNKTTGLFSIFVSMNQVIA